MSKLFNYLALVILDKYILMLLGQVPFENSKLYHLKISSLSN